MKPAAPALLLLGLVLMVAGPVTADDGDKAPKVDLDFTCPADLRDGALRILENEGVVAADEAGRTAQAPRLPPVAQPVSVLPPIAVALALVRREEPELRLTWITALGDIRALYTSGVDPQVWLGLAPPDTASESEREALAARLQALFEADKTLQTCVRKVQVDLFEKDAGKGKLARVRLDVREQERAPKAGVPDAVPGKRIVALARKAGNLDAGAEDGVRVERDEVDRHETRIRKIIISPGRDPAVLWSSLREMEDVLHVTVIEVRMHGLAHVRFAVRHPWIASDDLRHDMEQTLAARPKDREVSSVRLRLRCREDQLVALARLLSAPGMELRRADGERLRPTSPQHLVVDPGTGRLLAAIDEVLRPARFRLAGFWGPPDRLYLRIRQDIPAKEPKAEAADTHEVIERRLIEAWKGMAGHTFLKQRLGGGEVITIRDLPRTAGGPRSVYAKVEITTRNRETLATRVEAGRPLAGNPVADVRAIAQKHGLTWSTGPDARRTYRYRDGLLRVDIHGSIAMAGAGADAVLRFLRAAEGLRGAALLWVDWAHPGVARSDEPGGALLFRLSRQYPLWAEQK